LLFTPIFGDHSIMFTHTQKIKATAYWFNNILDSPTALPKETVRLAASSI
jgi:hypothetical protein